MSIECDRIFPKLQTKEGGKRQDDDEELTNQQVWKQRLIRGFENNRCHPPASLILPDADVSDE
eukprot:3465911-Pleurochrysis_carterae.AAC.1